MAEGYGPGRPRRHALRWRPVLAAAGVVLLWLLFLALPVSGGRAPGDLQAAIESAAGPVPTVTAPTRAPTAVDPSGAAPSPAAPVPTVTAPTRALTTVDPSGAASSPSAPVPSGPVPGSGPRTFAVAAGGTQPVGDGATAIRYTVEVEDGLPWAAGDVAVTVDGILGDGRSWIGLGRWTLQRVDAGADARILIATPDTVDALCAPLRTSGRYSCRNGPLVVLNAARWAEGAASWGADVEGYRGYLVNHEFGHVLGFGHVGCPSPGAPAPVMMQQTKGVGECLPNAWPTVTGG